MRWFLLVLVLAGTGCVGMGYQRTPPPDSTWQSSTEESGARYTAHIYQPNPTQAEAFKQALAQVRRIFHDPDFHELVRAYDAWITRAQACDASEVDKEFQISGEEVVSAVLSRKDVEVHYLVNFLRGPTDVARTDIWARWTDVRPSQVAKWNAASIAQRAEFINTVAHELSHLVASTAGGFRFIDDDHDSACTERHLVSYRLGQMAGCYYEALQQSDDAAGADKKKAAFNQCMVKAKMGDVLESAECSNTLKQLAESCGEAWPVSR